MGFSVIDLNNPEHCISVNFWNWRPTVEIISTLRLLDADRVEALNQQFSGALVSRDEARAIAHHLREKVLVSLPAEGRILLDGSPSGTPDDGVFYRKPEEQARNYGATHEWLEIFAIFCETCDGFELI